MLYFQDLQPGIGISHDVHSNMSLKSHRSVATYHGDMFKHY